MDTTCYLNQSIEEELIESLYQQILASGKNYNEILFIGRGGMSIAQRLAYKLDITNLHQGITSTNDQALFVDDISCTGKTLNSIFSDTATLVYRSTSKIKPDFFALEVKSANYIKFSWER